MIIGTHYQLIEKIAEGGMGAVHKARDMRTRELVALKLLHDDDRTTRRVMTRFAVEALALRRIDHPNVVRLKFTGIHDGRPFIVMELVEGEDLNDLIYRRGRLTTRESLEIAVDLCRGLEATHAVDVLHRDVKPSNVLVDAETSNRLRVRLTDFGLARLHEYAITRAEEAVGTPAFMAPEQAVGDAPDVRTDVHGIGVVLFIMLTGAMPYEQAAPDVQLAFALHRCPPDVSQLRPRLSPEIDRVVRTTLRKDRAARYATVRDLREDLERLLGTRPGAPVGVPMDDGPDVYRPTSELSQRVASRLRRRSTRAGHEERAAPTGSSRPHR